MEFYIQLLHPKLVHFPIAFFAGALGLELISLVLKRDNLHHAAIVLYVMAALITPLVVLSGSQEAQHLKLHHPVLEIHRKFALTTMWCSLGSLPILWSINKKNKLMFKFTFIICLMAIVSSVLITAYNGGRMVYEYGVGVAQ